MKRYITPRITKKIVKMELFIEIMDYNPILLAGICDMCGGGTTGGGCCYCNAVMECRYDNCAGC